MDLPTYKISLTHKFYTRLRELHNLPQVITIPHLSHSHQLSSKLTNTNNTAQLANYHKLAMHINGESLNRRRSLHERWKSELIPKEGSTNDGTTMPKKGGRYKLCQQPGLESSGRPTIGTNSPNLDHRGYITDL